MGESSASTREKLLEGIPLFSFLGADERALVAAVLTEVSYRKGDDVCREGEEGDSFFIVLSGELEVRTGPDAERLVSRLGPGDFLGEVALLLGGKRSATVRVARSAKLLVLDRSGFDRYFARNPKVLEHFARVLAQRLATTIQDEKVARQVLAIGVTGRRGLKGKTLVATGLAAFLREFSGHEVLLVRTSPARFRRGPRPILPLLSKLVQEPSDRIKAQARQSATDPALLTVEVDPVDSPEFLTESLSTLIAKVGDRFPYVVLDLACNPPSLSQCAEEVCDAAVEIVAQASPNNRAPERSVTRRYRVLNLYCRGSSPTSISHSEPFVLSVERGLDHRDPNLALAHLRANPRTLASASLRRLARKILGGTVGIAVGGGAAFGIAHVGVLKVLEDNGIPIDLLAGTSMGSIVAIGYATGMTPSQMLDIARRLGNVRTTLSALDFTLTRGGLLAGNRLVNIFGPLTGDRQTFEDLVFPCQVVATDIRSGDRVTIGSGRLDTAFRASCSVPMLWAPVHRDGRVLVDGGVIDPVPAQLVSEMGGDFCIAVNVVPALKEGIETVLSMMYRRVGQLNPLNYMRDRRDLPNLFDIVMNSIQTLEHELGNFKAISADVRINPDLSRHTWVEFYRAEEIIERGMEATDRALPLIRRALAERMSAASHLASTS
jgi:NTE family protein